MVEPQGSPVLEKEVRIRIRPETIFPFFTDPEKMVRWKGATAMLDPRPGGIYRVVMTSRDTGRGEYVEVTPTARWCSPGAGRAMATPSRRAPAPWRSP